MKLVSIFSFLFFSFLPLFNGLSCELSNDITSFSGPITHTLYSLDLLSIKKRVKSISIYNGIKEKDFDGKILPGGIFLSPSVFDEVKNSVIFYDKSENLRKLFSEVKKESQAKFEKDIEVDSFGKDPFETFELTFNLLKPYLKNCDEKYEKEKLKEKELTTKILKLKGKLDGVLLFYLGEFFKGGRFPSRLMVGDSLALFFKKNNFLTSYPTDLSYLPWSDKVIQKLRKLKKPMIHIGLTGRRKEINDSFDKIIFEKYEENNEIFINIYGAGVLIPGIYQIMILEKLVNYLEEILQVKR